ncbi:hypothetical protein X948_5219 [Burkholderia pseudomallei MSHR5608]|nr:hypothetical protein X948_5219 [Burkholderia pseudomallei MSHR5608]
MISTVQPELHRFLRAIQRVVQLRRVLRLDVVVGLALCDQRSGLNPVDQRHRVAYLPEIVVRIGCVVGSRDGRDARGFAD